MIPSGRKRVVISAIAFGPNGVMYGGFYDLYKIDAASGIAAPPIGPLLGQPSATTRIVEGKNLDLSVAAQRLRRLRDFLREGCRGRRRRPRDRGVAESKSPEWRRNRRE